MAGGVSAEWWRVAQTAGVLVMITSQSTKQFVMQKEEKEKILKHKKICVNN